MTLDREVNFLTRFCIPEFEGAIATGGNNLFTIGTKIEIINGLIMGFNRAN